MGTELSNWQTRLERQFAALRGHRGTNGSERPIFALEHGLDAQEIRALEAALRAHIADRPPSRDHALAWIVYSSELGYRYSGDEYWQTFEQETPGWTDHGNRYWLRQWFRNFQKEFGGAVPTGLWAEHFSIICWPITHAVLPKDLQRQLARILYELRHLFSGDILESPVSLGELIAARSWNTTSRFQNLTQETRLLGQIAAALLFQGDFGTGNLIHPAALRRIGEDLDQERRAREWLRRARQSARARTQVRGLGMLGRGTRSTNISRLDDAREEITALGIEPRLMLRPTNSSSVLWEVSLEIPDLSHLLLRFPQTRPILTGSRCVVAGASGRPLARGRCLHGTQRVRLAQWPRADDVLLQFEQSDPQLDYLLRAECLLRPGLKWLFRVASDGLAYECRSLRVRPGQQYILVSTAEPLQSNSHASPIDLSCEEIYGALVKLPQALTVDWEESLQTLGLEQAKMVEVWPAGLAAAEWDGEGYGEWFASEQPCLAILTDHAVESLLISMDGNANPPLELTSVNPGQPIFVELPQISVGRHTVHVSATSIAGETALLGDLDMVMRIREPRPWSPGDVSPQGPLFIHMDPPVPTLEELWEGRADVSLQGPTDRRVKCRVSLFERDAETAIFSKQLPQIGMPFTAGGWRAHFEKHFQNPQIAQEKKKTQEAYDISRICQLEFDADELGAFTVRCEREFTPLRWALRRQGDRAILRLLDDSGDSEQLVVRRMGFETPCVDESLAPASEYQVPDSGAMYVAGNGRFSTAIIVPPPVVRGLEDLRCNPRIERQGRSIDALVRAIKIASLWGGARLAGDLMSALRQKDVMRELVRDVFRLICGDNWAEAENRDTSNAFKALETLSRAVSKHASEAAVGVEILQDAESLAADTCEARIQRLASLASRYHLTPSPPTASSSRFDREGDLTGSAPTDVNSPEWLAEFLLRLASNPASVETWAGKHLHDALKFLLEMPTVARAARFLVIATDHFHQSGSGFGEIYAGWRWT